MLALQARSYQVKFLRMGKIKLLGGDWVPERLKQAQFHLGVLQGIEQIMQFRLTLWLLQNFEGIKR